MRSVGAVLAAVAVTIVAAVVGVGAWQLGWFIEQENVDRRVQVDNRNTGTQTAWRDEARRTVADYAVLDPDNTAARGAMRTQACGLIARLRPDYLDADLAAFQAGEC